MFRRFLVLQLYRMPTTRSASRAATSVSHETTSVHAPKAPKRKAKEAPSETAKKEKKPRVAKPTSEVSAVTQAQIEQFQRNLPEPGPAPVLVPAQLSFSFEEAKTHLISVDPRFQILFDRLDCKPFEQLETVHPFRYVIVSCCCRVLVTSGCSHRALVTSIVGQQISWIAARSVNHKFVRLYKPSLPEKVTDYEYVSNSYSGSLWLMHVKGKGIHLHLSFQLPIKLPIRTWLSFGPLD